MDRQERCRKEDLPKQYVPKQVENGWNDWWIERKFFEFQDTINLQPQDESTRRERTFVTTITPPNVSGNLHLGHALTITLQDTFTRWHRMKGKNVLWVPGLDHAGISAKLVVERKLGKEQRKPLHELDEEEVLEEIKEMMEVQSEKIKDQLKELGPSYDWERYTFTLDEGPSRAVAEAFCLLHDEGLIRREERLVQWSCYLRTALSNMEIEERKICAGGIISPPGYDTNICFGEEISFAYEVIDAVDVQEVVVTTPRIEWMLGHTAVVIQTTHADAKKLKGKKLKHPFFDRILPIIVDDTFIGERKTKIIVWKTSETRDVPQETEKIGAQGVVPAHDFDSYNLWKKSKGSVESDSRFDIFQVIDDAGYITDQCGEGFRGKKRFEVREEIVKELTRLGQYRGRRDAHLAFDVCSTTDDIIELQIKEEWFFDISREPETHEEDVSLGNRTLPPQNSVAAEALAVLTSELEDQHLQIKPSNFEVDLKTCLEDAKPWLISRQGKWGHEIPAYLATGKIHQETCWIAGTSRKCARQKAANKLNEEIHNVHLSQEKGVLDTWFSSAILPFSIFDWPEKKPILQQFFPGTMLETGNDILKVWVSRMIMMSVKIMDKLPFKEIYLHKMINDANGKKMGKTHGNVIDPSDVINGITGEELERKLLETHSNAKDFRNALDDQSENYPNGYKACGVDALRLGLISYVSQDENIIFKISDIEECKEFCQMMWTGFCSALPLFEKCNVDRGLEPAEYESLDTRAWWMIYLVGVTVRKMNIQFGLFNFKQAMQAARQFWCDLCKWYLVHLSVKDVQSVKTLYTCLDQGLRLLHPVMPFITEELFQRLPGRVRFGDSICIMIYPDEATSQTVPDAKRVPFEHLNNSLNDYLKTIAKIDISQFSLEVLLPGNIRSLPEMEKCYRDVIRSRFEATSVSFYDSENEELQWRLTSRSN